MCNLYQYDYQVTPVIFVWITGVHIGCIGQENGVASHSSGGVSTWSGSHSGTRLLTLFHSYGFDVSCNFCFCSIINKFDTPGVCSYNIRQVL